MDRYRVAPSFPLEPHPFPAAAGRRAPAGNEIAIFSAERYFRDAVDDSEIAAGPVPRESSASSASAVTVTDLWDRTKNATSLATPTASSEASYNSRSGLLPAAASSRMTPELRKPPRPPAAAAAAPPPRRRRFGCPCLGKKSVRADKPADSPARPPKISSPTSPELQAPLPSLPPLAKMKITAGGNWNKSDSFMYSGSLFSPTTKTILPPAPAPAPRRITNSGKPFISSSTGFVPDEPPRVSLEVFRPAEDRMPRRRLSRAAEEEAYSDASSDLFELESFAATSASCRRRESLDELSAAGGAPSEFLYPPSEKSVVWSVVTAEGGGGFDRGSVANFSSAASEYEALEAEHHRFASAMAAGAGKKNRTGGGLLDSCRCEKAVNVGPNPVRIDPPVGRVLAEPELGLGRIGPGRITGPAVRAHLEPEVAIIPVEPDRSFARVSATGPVRVGNVARCQPTSRVQLPIKA